MNAVDCFSHLRQVEENGWDDEVQNEQPAARVEEQFISAPAEFGNSGEAEAPIDIGAQNGKRCFEEQYVLTNGQGMRARALYDYQAGKYSSLFFFVSKNPDCTFHFLLILMCCS